MVHLQNLEGSIHSWLNLSIELVDRQDLPYLRKVFASRYLGSSLCSDDDVMRHVMRD